MNQLGADFMRVSRIFYPEISSRLSSLTLSSEISHYLIRVLRHKNSHQVIFFNNIDGCEYLSTITDANPKAASLAIESISLKQNESPVKSHLFQALSKGDKLEMVIQKMTELGIHHITPIITEHVDYKLSHDRIESKQMHWQKIAVSASEQSGRVFVPKVHPPLDLAQALQTSAEIKLFLSPYAQTSIQQLQQQFPQATSFNLYVGPEGGFSATEEAFAIDNNCHNIRLGSRILRTETAPLAMLSVLQVLWGDY